MEAENKSTAAAATRLPPPDEDKDTSEYTIVQTGTRRRHAAKPGVIDVDDEPLIDTTAALELNSKKTKRLQKQQLKKKKKTEVRSDVNSFLELPHELLEEVLSHLQPSDIYSLMRINRATRDFILENEASIARQVIRTRYWILDKAFPLPYPLTQVDELTQTALLNNRRQEMLNIHKKPYQHIPPIDPHSVCTCMTCVLAWNNLCLILDFAHFQHHLSIREPIPMIPRGTSTVWNQELVAQHAVIVQRAMGNPLAYAAILQKHLATTLGTITRISRARFQKRVVYHSKNINPKLAQPSRRLYELTDEEADNQTDEFLARKGPSSYEFPFHRDNYYSLQAYIPNRKWSEPEARWKYYDTTQHEKDLTWARQWFLPSETRPQVNQQEVEKMMNRMDGMMRPDSHIEPGTPASQN